MSLSLALLRLRLFLGLALSLLVAGSALGEAREVSVGVYESAPKLFMDADGRPSGILGDLLQEIAAREEWTLRPVPCAWNECLAALRAGKIDLLPDVALSQERAQTLDFHQHAALNSWSGLYLRAGVDVNSVLDLADKRVAVLAGSVQQDYLSHALAGFDVKAELAPLQSMEEVFEKTAAGACDAAIAKGQNGDLLAAIDHHLGNWQGKADSVYTAIMKRWMAPAPRTVVPASVWWALPA